MGKRVKGAAAFNRRRRNRGTGGRGPVKGGKQGFAKRSKGGSAEDGVSPEKLSLP